MNIRGLKFWLSAGGGILLLVVAGIWFSGRSSAKRGEPTAPPGIPYLSGNDIVIPDTFAKRIGFAGAKVVRHDLDPVIQVIGTVTFDPEYSAAVGTRIRGFVRRLVKIEGDQVKKGDVLAEVESAELGEAQAAVSIAQAQKNAAALNADREGALAQEKLTTAREAEVAGAMLNEQTALLTAAEQRVRSLGGQATGGFGVYALRSPLKGTVVERHVAAGQSVEGNLTAYKVADLSHLWIELQVFERSLQHIRVGDTVEVKPIANTQQLITGVIAHVGDVINTQSRSAEVRVKVDNQNNVLRPGQAVVATIKLQGPAVEHLLIPSTSVTYVDGMPTVFLIKSNLRVVPIHIELGSTDGKQYEVIKGISEGAEIVSSGVFALKSELFR